MITKFELKCEVKTNYTKVPLAELDKSYVSTHTQTFKVLIGLSIKTLKKQQKTRLSSALTEVAHVHWNIKLSMSHVQVPLGLNGTLIIRLQLDES